MERLSLYVCFVFRWWLDSLMILFYRDLFYKVLQKIQNFNHVFSIARRSLKRTASKSAAGKKAYKTLRRKAVVGGAVVGGGAAVIGRRKKKRKKKNR